MGHKEAEGRGGISRMAKGGQGKKATRMAWAASASWSGAAGSLSTVWTCLVSMAGPFSGSGGWPLRGCTGR